MMMNLWLWAEVETEMEPLTSLVTWPRHPSICLEHNSSLSMMIEEIDALAPLAGFVA